MILNNQLYYKCYIRAININMKICGIYYKKNKILIRILGQSKKIYSINIFIINGHFNCSCKYHLKYNI